MVRISFLILLFSQILFSQVLISTKSDKVEPHPDAILELSSDRGAFILPAITNSEAEKIKNNQPIEGMIIYNKDTKQFLGYTGTEWEVLNGGRATAPLSPTDEYVNKGDILINEFHYTNIGGGENEFIEIKAIKDLNISNLTLYLYNGASGGIIKKIKIRNIQKTSDSEYDYYVWDTTVQDGPDGIAIADRDKLLEFITYEEEFTATEGPASGEKGFLIPVSENNMTAKTASIYRDSNGSWEVTTQNTKGKKND